MCAKKIQDERVQYDTCDATAGSGRFKHNGYCVSPGSVLMLEIQKNSQSLRNTVNFRNNTVYYLTSNDNNKCAYQNLI